MNLRYNINKIHIDLTSYFYKGEVKIEEKSSLKYGNYFQVSIINENREVRAILTKKELDSNSDSILWSYYSNPMDEKSDLVERSSKIDQFSSDVKDIFEKNRFDNEYLKK